MLEYLRFPIIRLSMVVCRRDKGAAYQIEHFALHDQVMKRIHDLLNRGRPVPQVHVQDVDIRCTELLERCLNGEV